MNWLMLVVIGLVCGILIGCEVFEEKIKLRITQLHKEKKVRYIDENGYELGYDRLLPMLFTKKRENYMYILKKILTSKTFYAILITISIIEIPPVIQEVKYTPIEFLRFSEKRITQNIHKPLKQIEFDDKKVLVLYCNQNGKLSYALLKKGILGYKTVDGGGELEFKSDSNQASLLFGFYNESRNWVGCGVIYDDSVAEIIINGNNAKIINVGDISAANAKDVRIWYLLGEGERNPHINYKILDYNGKVIKSN